MNINDNEYTVTAIKETLDKTNIGNLKLMILLILERAMKLGDRLRWTYCTRSCRSNSNLYRY